MPEPRIVNPATPVRLASEPQGPSISISDIYYTLFRHKWKILLCSVAGFGAAFALYKLQPPPFVSEAKLFIRYVVTEGRTPGPSRDDTVTKSPDQRGETIIKSELEILTSMDLARDVVKSVGAARILAGATVDGDPEIAAATVVNRNLKVEVPLNSSVIRVAFVHPDPLVVQDILREIVGSYLKKHVEIHRAMGIVGDFLIQETDQLRTRLTQTEEELRAVMNKAGVISLEDSKKSFAEQIARLRQQTFDVEAELASRTSVFQQMSKVSPENQAAVQRSTAVPPEQVAAYQNLAAQVTQLRNREQQLLSSYTEQSALVQEVRALRDTAEEQQRKLEAEYPALNRVPSSPSDGGRPVYDIAAEAAQIVALQARITVLNEQLASVRQEAAKVDLLEISILELRRRKELEEANYRYYSANLEQSRINEALGTGRVSNISVIESPTPPEKDWSLRIKILGGIAAGGVILGLGWAFLIEMFMDRTVRRTSDVQRALRLPLFLSVPRMKPRTLRAPSAANAALPAPAGSDKAAKPSAPLASAGPSALDPFHETLRDRLINYFDTLNNRNKPKLVAVTGLGKGSGVTTVASGLARSFSEIGEGNVLLVDMTKGQGSVQHFQKGATGVDLEKLLQAKSSAKVDDNLYVVSENSNSERLAKGMPQRFNQLIPQLKASDFDYIIFDMPAVSQISITPRLASFMDMMLMVVESEKTDREAAANATAMLAGAKTPVGVVLNKTKAYVPRVLQDDALNDL